MNPPAPGKIPDLGFYKHMKFRFNMELLPKFRNDFSVLLRLIITAYGYYFTFVEYYPLGPRDTPMYGLYGHVLPDKAGGAKFSIASLRSMAVLLGTLLSSKTAKVCLKRARTSREAARKIKTACPVSWPFQLPPPSSHFDIQLTTCLVSIRNKVLTG